MTDVTFNASGIATFVLNGVLFQAKIVADDCMGAPWIEHDGHGPVSDWTTRPKAPGERVLSQDRSSKRYYDVAEAIRIAKRDGWDAAPYTPVTSGQKAARAVESDFRRLQAWCNDEWRWIGVVVTARCACCNAYTGPSDSLWAIESDSGDYRSDVALELARGLTAALRAPVDASGAGQGAV